MALFSECMQRCDKKTIDRAGVVRDAWLRQPSELYLSGSRYPGEMEHKVEVVQLPDGKWAVIIDGALWYLQVPLRCRLCRTDHTQARKRCVRALGSSLVVTIDTSLRVKSDVVPATMRSMLRIASYSEGGSIGENRMEDLSLWTRVRIIANDKDNAIR